VGNDGQTRTTDKSNASTQLASIPSTQTVYSTASRKRPVNTVESSIRSSNLNSAPFGQTYQLAHANHNVYATAYAAPIYGYGPYYPENVGHGPNYQPFPIDQTGWTYPVAQNNNACGSFEHQQSVIRQSIPSPVAPAQVDMSYVANHFQPTHIPPSYLHVSHSQLQVDNIGTQQPNPNTHYIYDGYRTNVNGDALHPTSNASNMLIDSWGPDDSAETDRVLDALEGIGWDKFYGYKDHPFASQQTQGKEAPQMSDLQNRFRVEDPVVIAPKEKTGRSKKGKGAVVKTLIGEGADERAARIEKGRLTLYTTKTVPDGGRRPGKDSRLTRKIRAMTDRYTQDAYILKQQAQRAVWRESQKRSRERARLRREQEEADILTGKYDTPLPSTRKRMSTGEADENGTKGLKESTKKKAKHSKKDDTDNSSEDEFDDESDDDPANDIFREFDDDTDDEYDNDAQDSAEESEETVTDNVVSEENSDQGPKE
jgi:hypothetical protein